MDERVLDGMKDEAKRSGRTLGAEITEALARELRRRRLGELIAEYEAEHGTITDEEMAALLIERQASPPPAPAER